MEWDDSARSEALWAASERFLSNDKVLFPHRCPICGERQLHLYCHRWREHEASLWAWCSACRHAAHAMNWRFPNWYENYSVIREADLSVFPIVLEQHAHRIDLFENRYVRRFPLPPYISREESEVLLRAELELWKNGTASVRCPRCGKKLLLSSTENQPGSWTVRCENPRCLQAASHGFQALR